MGYAIIGSMGTGEKLMSYTNIAICPDCGDITEELFWVGIVYLIKSIIM